MALKEKIKQNPALKQAVHRFIMHPVKTRPNWWIRIFSFLYLKRGKGSVIYRSVRQDLPPFNLFSLGKYSVVEQCCRRPDYRGIYPNRTGQHHYRPRNHRQPCKPGTECNRNRTEP